MFCRNSWRLLEEDSDDGGVACSCNGKRLTVGFVSLVALSFAVSSLSSWPSIKFDGMGSAFSPRA
jgi:hypothetical protein